jgi:hypothetical protein
MKVYILEESANPKKKFTAIRLNPSLKRISFGAKGYEDYTTSKDENKKKNYLERHSSNENWKDTDTAGFWARWLLWNKKTIEESIIDIEKKFNIKIVKGY